MNEQLVVKNFGPIKDATVDFKRVTVFIGPTGGGKSTLAKLAAVFRDGESFFSGDEQKRTEQLSSDLALYGIQNYGQMDTDVCWNGQWISGGFGGEEGGIRFSAVVRAKMEKELAPRLQKLASEYGIASSNVFAVGFAMNLGIKSPEAIAKYWQITTSYFPTPKYIPADRAMAAFVTGAAFQLQSHKAGLSSVLIDFLS